jgi:hypothetical protein
MMQITPQQLDTATVRALSSLTKRDAAAVRATVRATGNLYRVDEHDDYDGYLSLLLTPLQAGCGFLVSGRTGAIDLAELQGDEMVPLGRFPSIGAAMLSLRPALERDSGIATPGEEAQRLLDRHGSDADLHAALRADAGDGERWHAVIRAIDRRDEIS